MTLLIPCPCNQTLLNVAIPRLIKLPGILSTMSLKYGFVSVDESIINESRLVAKVSSAGGPTRLCDVSKTTGF